MEKVQEFKTAAITVYQKKIVPFLSRADDELLKRVPQTKAIQDKNIRPCFVALAAAAFVLMVFAWMIGAAGLTNLVGFVYPVVASFKARKAGNSTEVVNKWMTYWIIFSLFNVIESITDLLYEWVPQYYLVKAIVLVYAFAPSSNFTELINSLVTDKLMAKFPGPAPEKEVKEVARTVTTEDASTANEAKLD
mmetsp:Transcript_20969/g.29537  ORF Transcript_20969/g.29537 Transcript_20969/m.29537 type:complete len:192 (+) Transcript_20969:30-605(+)|eukprot:CAMPEP_0175097418 /NCGR_PEP_ID=MMETSP0086_2-20121207/5276_1 /TAXON_ID=136419 /ORGANISM="Unknown Unknown, Strain D1" /LENGTH=191 /DNA_ID=CAMNT_0016370927 /DNA_START=41 /DNA_END=616 /DNA_ORIENTATION=+